MVLPTFRFLALLAIILLAGCSDQDSAVPADWILDSTKSSLSITSIKKGSVGEAHSFRSLIGVVSPTGLVKVSITLASIESNIDIRNQRMQKMLFETASFPVATITSQVSLADFTSLYPGNRIKRQLSFTLELHGAKQELEADVFISRLSDTAFTVSTQSPVMLDAADFGLAKGIESLREIAGLPSISHVVPTSFNLLFHKK